MAFTSINLAQQQQLTGTITAMWKQQTKGSKTIPGRKALMLKIDSKDIEYLIFRASQNYSDIISTLKPGDNVKIYYGFYRREYHDFTIYQLESNSKVIYSKNEYEDQEQFAGRFILIPGGLITLAMVLYKIRKRYKAKNNLWLSEQ
jgi:hypothetical protein